MLSCNQFQRRRDFPYDYHSQFGDDPETVICRGGSCIVDPFGNSFPDPTPMAKQSSSPKLISGRLFAASTTSMSSATILALDIFQLHVDERPKHPVNFTNDASAAAID